MKKLIILMCFFVGQNVSKAQSDLDPNSIVDMMAGKSAYITNENLEINIFGKDDGGYGGSANNGVYATPSNKSFRIRRDITIKIMDEAGLDLFKKICLPEHFDPTFITHSSQVKNLGIYYSAYKIKSFKVEVKRQGKKLFSPKIKKRIEAVESFNLVYLYEYSNYEYSIEGLEVGDEVRIRYDLNIPFQQNYSRFASYRMFFHDSLPKLKYQLTITHHESMDIRFNEFNGAATKRHYKEDNIITRIWDYKNLTGCINEEGSKPYKELPHVTWVIDYFKYYVHNSWKLENVPHYAIIASMRADKLPEIITSVSIGSNSKEFMSFKKSYRDYDEKFESDHEVVRAIHKSIVEDFDYKNDKEFYRRNDMRTERLGEFFENRILRDVSRYNMYFAILAFADIPFYSAFVVDNRSGEISEEYFQPNFDNDYLIGVYFGERAVDMILPKRGKSGWYYNEIPFYYENCNGRLVHITDYAIRKAPIKETFRNLETHITPAELNIRKQRFNVKVDLEADSLFFKGDINLSGQFSTMCRTASLGGYKDPTVSQFYTKSLWNFIPNSQLSNKGDQVVSSDYPFEAHIERSFVSGGKMHSDGSSVSIDLSHWFPHVRPTINNAQSRFLAYYSDFKGTDDFEYEIHFSQPIQLENPVKINVVNDFAKYVFNVIQKDAASILVTSTYQIKSEMVSGSDFNEVQELIRAINLADSYTLKVH